MTIRTFWHLIIKTLGIWIFIRGLIAFPELAMKMIVAYQSPFMSSNAFVIHELLMFIVPVAFFILILRYLVLKTQRIIDLLKLEKGMEETRIDLTVPFEKLLRIIVILIGGLLAVSSVPDLLRNLYVYIASDYGIKDNPVGLPVITSGVQFVLGFLILSNSDIVLRYINTKSSESENKQLDNEDF